MLGFLKPRVPRGRLRVHAGVDFVVFTGNPSIGWTTSREYDEDDDSYRVLDRNRPTTPFRYGDTGRRYHVG